MLDDILPIQRTFRLLAEFIIRNNETNFNVSIMAVSSAYKEGVHFCEQSKNCFHKVDKLGDGIYNK